MPPRRQRSSYDRQQSTEKPSSNGWYDTWSPAPRRPLYNRSESTPYQEPQHRRPGSSSAHPQRSPMPQSGEVSMQFGRQFSYVDNKGIVSPYKKQEFLI